MHTLSKLFSTALLLSLAHLAAAQQVTAVRNLDQNHFVGTWYEIARYPYKREKACVGNTLLLVALADKANQVQFVNSCEDKKGYADVRNSTARGPKVKAGGASNGEFKVTSVWPFSTKIWVLGLAADDSWAVLGSPDRRHLWVFSKTRLMNPASLAQAEAVALGEGFDLKELSTTPAAKPVPTAGAQ